MSVLATIACVDLETPKMVIELLRLHDPAGVYIFPPAKGVNVWG